MEKELEDIISELGNSHDDFKSKYDAKVDLLQQQLNEVEKKTNRLNFGGGQSPAGGYLDREAKNDLAKFLRSRGEVKTMTIGTDPQGGYSVHPFLAEGIAGLVRNNSALRKLVNFIPLPSGDNFEELLSTSPVGTTWVGEQTSRPATDNPALAKISTSLHEHYCMPVLSQRLADDSSVSMVDWLVSEAALSFAEAEETALFDGLGVISPLGLNNYPCVATADASRAFGDLQYIPTGVSADFAADPNGFAAVKTLFYTLKAGYRSDAKWLCNSATALELSLLKDGNDNYLWSEGNISLGSPPTILGKEVVISEAAPVIAANSKSLWFGDWNQAFRGIERPESRLLVDPYSAKPNLQVYIYRRFGLQLRNSNAIKALKFATA
jgi:HK97 family phage major capsid protein